MDRRTEKARTARVMLVREIGRIFFSARELSKDELFNACQVKLDAQWMHRLHKAGILVSTHRGRGAKYTLAPGITPVDLLANADKYAGQLKNQDVETHNESRRQAKAWDYRREIKRLKMILDSHGIAY